VIALGVGYTSRCSADELAGLAEAVLQRARDGGAGGHVATLERKRADGLLEVVAARLALTPAYLTAAELEAVQANSGSPRVAAVVGAGSVAEAAALAAAGPGATLVVAKTASRHATCAAARRPDTHATEEGPAP
jgi:cobalt-precorrin 5A hydrolase